MDKYINFRPRLDRQTEFDEVIALLQDQGLNFSSLINSILPTLQKALKESKKIHVIELNDVIKIV